MVASSYIETSEEVTWVNASMAGSEEEQTTTAGSRRLLDADSLLSVGFTVALVSEGNHTELVEGLAAELVSATNSSGNGSFAAVFVSAAEEYVGGGGGGGGGGGSSGASQWSVEV